MTTTPRIVDIASVNDLLARYALTMDRRRLDQWVALFTPGAELAVGSRRYRGHDELRAMAEASMLGIHLPGPTNVEIDGDHAVSEQTFVFVSTAESVISTGFYNDRLVRTADGWRFEERLIEVSRATL